MKKSQKIIIGSVTGLLLLIIAVCFGAGKYLVSYAIGRGGDGGNRDVSLEIEEIPADEIKKTILENKAIQKELTEEFLQREKELSTEITSSDGIPLKGFYFENNSHDWAISIHGYRSSHISMRKYAQHFFDNGFNVLLPDLRGCGESGGSFVGMGWLDRKDILLWIDWILQKDPEAKIVIHGVSMGGATTMMTSGEETPDAVVAFIEDCGYTSVWDIFASELKLRFHLPTFPILNSASLISKIDAKYSFTEASSIKQLKKCTKPMLFIHGTADDFIEFGMLDKVYEAKAGNNKSKLVAEGAGHGEAMDALAQTYWDTIFDFLSKI